MALIPEEDIEFLDEKEFDYELVQAEGAVHLILHHFPFTRYVPKEADMLIRLPPGYPQTAVDMFYTIPDVKLPSGTFPDRCGQHPVFGGKVWQQWSRHSTWRVGIDSLRTFLSAVIKEIDKGFNAMRYTLTFREEEYQQLTAHLFPFERENAAYLLCGISTTGGETRLLVREVIPVPDEDIEHASDRHMQIRQSSYLSVIKAAADRNLSFVFVHSHPSGFLRHSDQDDETESPLFQTAYNRIHSLTAVHGSIVLSSPDQPVGRVWLEDGSIVPMERVRVIGNRFRFAMNLVDTPLRLNFFSRHVLAFGEDLQKLLQQLTIGIVGMGGTGSAVAEQLLRLGIGRILTADGEVLEDSNVTRVYGSRVRDVGAKKVEVLRRHAEDIGLGTAIEALSDSMTRQSIIERFRECDLIFGCTDREWGRSILAAFALYYLVPVFDLGVRVETDEDNIKSIQARVTTLLPGAACLFCRGRISGDVIAAEILQETNPAEYESQRKQGYIPELGTRAPAVIPFTSAIASFAINELLHRLSGYMGDDRISTELFVLFDNSRISRNSTAASPECMCSNRKKWGRGDADPFLGLTWGNEE